MSGMQLSIHIHTMKLVIAGDIKGCKHVKIITLCHMNEEFMIKFIEII